MKITLLAVCAALALCSASFAAEGRKAADDCRAQGEAARIVPEKLTLTQEWDKTFPKSDKVDHRKVTFVNRFGITLAADLYTPKGMTGRLPALAVAGAFGAVKEQISGRYAQIMAERGCRQVFDGNAAAGRFAAAGPGWRSTLPPSTRASKPPSRRRCTT